MASKSYGWDVRNIAKIGPKMVKKGHFSTSEGKRPKPTPLPHMRLWLSVFFSNTPEVTKIVLQNLRRQIVPEEEEFIYLETHTKCQGTK